MKQLEKLYEFPIIEANGISVFNKKTQKEEHDVLLGLLFHINNTSQIKSIIDLVKIRVSIILTKLLPSFLTGKILEIHYIYPSITNPAIIYSSQPQSSIYAQEKILPQYLGIKKIIMKFLNIVLGIPVSVAGVIIIKKMHN